MKGLSVTTALLFAVASLASLSIVASREQRLKANHGDSQLDPKRFLCMENKKQMYTEDMSFTVMYKSGQILRDTLYDHFTQIQQRHRSLIPDRILYHPVLFSGFQLPGDVSEETLNFIRELPGIHSVGRSKLFKAHGALPWGLDRIDQKKLPLDGKYKPSHDGTGVNVFIVDSGLDTEHSEFKKDKTNRIVQNIFDSYNLPQTENIRPNNDGVGHGTHVTATIGGNTVGVSPGANLYGVRVLSDVGAGSDFDILGGLYFVYDWYKSNGKPSSIVSMSLGGECISYIDCKNDIIVEAVEILSHAGIVVVTAAGNSDCDSCLQTPAYAPHGITVGASSITDEAAVFSDFGKCIDIYAPGVNITSACGQAMCPGPQNQFISLSGTSMAAPHTTGVIAQLMQINPNATVDEITNLLSCTASSMVLSIKQDRPPGITRNLLLQIPYFDPLTVPDLNYIIGNSDPNNLITITLPIGSEKKTTLQIKE